MQLMATMRKSRNASSQMMELTLGTQRGVDAFLGEWHIFVDQLESRARGRHPQAFQVAVAIFTL